MKNDITKLTCKTSKIVGSIAALTLYVNGQQPLFFPCVAIPIHNEDFHRYSMQEVR